MEAIREHARCNAEWGSAGKCSDGKSSRLRKYARLLPLWRQSSDGVYRTLVEVTNDRIDVLHRYFGLRARMLDISDLGYHDIYPLVETDVSFPIEATRRP